MADYRPDVLVIGGGMAGLCAAISARLAGAKTRLLEAAPAHMRGGNLRHARNIRIPHDAPTRYSPGRYDVVEFAQELGEISSGKGEAALIRSVSHQAVDLADWLVGQGVVFQTRHIPASRRTAFFLGGGKAVVNALYARAQALGVEIRFESDMHRLDLDDLPAKAVAACCGSAQVGSFKTIINRGTPFNAGGLMQELVGAGAAAIGVPEAAHLVAVDGRSPAHDGGIVTRIDGMQFGVMVDEAGRRFIEETVVSGPRRYSLWGQAIARLSSPRATLVVDAEGFSKMPMMVFPPISAGTLADMAALIGMDVGVLSRSAEESGRVNKPPFFAWPVAPGFTFGCHGLHVDTRARVKMQDGSVRQNLFAAGSIMAAGILHTGYLSGTALTISAVFGRIAGREAARHALG
ncbi:FAD-binding protein [Rhizobium panacihumi]|uniref:FAD-binding protein n=1 Tax=Rhizobium panacihumi TaxID=2008450 RepID=UPI003D7B8AEE